MFGWMIFIPATIAGLLKHFSLINISGIPSIILNDAIIIGITLGAIFIVCSKARMEDEMISALRLSSILNTIYVFAALIILGTLMTNGEQYIELLHQILFFFPLMFVFTFSTELYRHNKQAENEEQD